MINDDDNLIMVIIMVMVMIWYGYKMIMIIIIIINNNIKIITTKLSSCLMGLFRDNKTNNSNNWSITGLRIPTGRRCTRWLFYKHSPGFELGTTINKFIERVTERDLNSKSPDYKFGAILFFQAASSNCRCNDLKSIPLSR